MYWSESDESFSIQGSPQLYAKGIVFQGNGQAIGGGGGTIDLTNVQMWVDTILASGTTTVRLKADPENSIAAFGGAFRPDSLTPEPPGRSQRSAGDDVDELRPRRWPNFTDPDVGEERVVAARARRCRRGGSGCRAGAR